MSLKRCHLRGGAFDLHGRPEADNLACRDFDGGTRAGIAAHTFGLLLDAETSQTGQRQPFSLAERLHRDTDHGVDCLSGLDLREVCVEGNSLDKLGFVHGLRREEINLTC